MGIQFFKNTLSVTTKTELRLGFAMFALDLSLKCTRKSNLQENPLAHSYLSSFKKQSLGPGR